ncbi:MAG: Asp-tRNA(Asn)/Glu-tRNA(Gln) amidotransferase subunit GatC [Erysipelotrichaceae bacterium]|nr:Asp-tRNA(Asn)/Glu-tRNA(Gln) amidotransferase subunit GatC [Erysipelotrichaceae bacterium]MBQ9987403.1 Asp-tRNA(Asn)/Glu-tRNA(Gln) amidotransferase subunit GatC [Erysipelotrichales bacterium]MBR3694110.1 Asp-tRNA(Asn)/Glu-tRNA(Gln) amidotransferase subunit GatC [Erysipelotrichales bacterium]
MKLEYRKLANQLMFDLSEEEIMELDREFETLLKQIDLLDSIDTEGVEPMVYPFQQATSYLREDEVDEVITQEEALSNVHKTRARHVLVPKVVK